jgi:colanic acid/amylovoran biosynthesis glycosyltransferase
VSEGKEQHRPDAGRPVRWAYLVSQYPAVNHTFILREIRGLREAGIPVDVASIREADRPADKMSAEEAEELSHTVYVRAKRASWPQAHLKTLLSRPGAYFGTLLYALSRAKWNLRVAVRHLAFFAEAVVVGRWVSGTGAACLHTHFASTVALFAARIFGFPFSVTVHGPDEFNDVESFLMREKVRAARLIVTISNYGRSQVLRAADSVDWEKVHVVRLGVDTAKYQPVARVNEKVMEVISVGRLAPAKAQEILIRSCAALIAEGRALRLRLVGDGPDREHLRSVAERLNLDGQVIFEGALSHDHVLDLYRQADIFALASFAEGVPVVLMEAMALQIPCAATRITGVPELIRDESEGLLAAPGSIPEFTQCLRRLMDDAGLRARLGAAGREKVVRDYDLSTNVAQLARLFLAINSETSGRSPSSGGMKQRL